MLYFPQGCNKYSKNVSNPAEDGEPCLGDIPMENSINSQTVTTCTVIGRLKPGEISSITVNYTTLWPSENLIIL